MNGGCDTLHAVKNSPTEKKKLGVGSMKQQLNQ